jgi:hypothetical protein
MPDPAAVLRFAAALGRLIGQSLAETRARPGGPRAPVRGGPAPTRRGAPRYGRPP